KPIMLYSYGAVAIVAAYVFVYVLERVSFSWINIIFSELGKRSLEMYLNNIFLLQMYEYFGLKEYLMQKYGESFMSMVVPQFAILFLGIFLSFAVSSGTTRLENFFQK